MRQALRQTGRGQTAVARSIPAPVGGWNTDDALPTMKNIYAVILDNWISFGGAIEMRRGYVDHVTGFADPVETLVTYAGDSAGDKIFACAGINIYDVTTAGGLGAAVYISAVSARWNWTNFANDAGRYVLMANGVQAPIKYNGTAWSTNALTGTSGSITLTDDDLKYVFAHKNFLHWLEKARLRVWYTAVNAIAGASNLLDLGPVLTSGGRLVGGATWSRDNGAGGLDDLAVYVTSEGQVAVYQGSDPGDANAWGIVGVYDIPRPVGERPLIKDGGELCIITEEGLLPLSAAIAVKKVDQKPLMLSAKIGKAFASSAASYRDTFGWQAIYYSGRGGLIIVNVPTEEDVSSVQYVRSSQSGAWSRFTGLPAICWTTGNGEIYFGGPEGVYQWDIGASDNGEAIVPDVLPAFSDFGNRTIMKEFTMVRALMYAPSIVVPAMDVVVEYDQDTLPTAVQTTVAPGDISTTDNTLIRNEWTGAVGIGYVASPRLRFSLIGSNDVDQVAVTEDHTELLLVGPGGTDNILTRPNLPLDVQVQLVGFDLLFNVGGQL